MSKNYDFSGWATKNDVLCSDGRIIKKDAFIGNDGRNVPLVWNHQHREIGNVLGHALLENRNEGVYAYCSFNDTEAGETAKKIVKHDDLVSLSICANHLKQNGNEVVGGRIRELSLVIAGANDEALIDPMTIEHTDLYDDSEVIIYAGEPIIQHSEEIILDDNQDIEPKGVEDCEVNKSDSDEANSTKPKEVTEDSEEKNNLDENSKSEILEHAEGEKIMAEENSKIKINEKDIKPINPEDAEKIFNTLNEEQKSLVYLLAGILVSDNNEGEEKEMAHNAFDNEEMKNDEVLSHAEMLEIFEDAKDLGSLEKAIIKHGITNIEYMYPDAKNVDAMPRFKKPKETWVTYVMNNVHHVPFARIKSLVADMTEDEARAKGYIKGGLKTDEVIAMLKRETTPTTIYKKQSIDRDDMEDIEDFNVVAFLKDEMQYKLDEENARAILIGDGRGSSSADKINPLNIRPIYTDDSLYSTKIAVTVEGTATRDKIASAFIDATISGRKFYKGTGTPTMFITEDVLADCLLLRDLNQRKIYSTMEELKTAFRVKDIVVVPVMDGQTRTVEGFDYDLMGILVDLEDYAVGHTKNGRKTFLDEFDIDYNKQKYLIETRTSGALIQPLGALVFEFKHESEAE